MIGNKFGKLTVLEQSTSINGKTYWVCQCECENIVIVRKQYLKNGQKKSCGCLSHGRKYHPGEKFNRLTTVSFKNGKWLCLCECGKQINVSTYRLTSGGTKSCGCLNNESRLINAQKMSDAIRKYEPKIATARSVWQRYRSEDKQCDLNFEDFLNLSQQNCFYCGISPSNKYNLSRFKKQNKGIFIYNGLDRINSEKYHTLDNVVPCCRICNRAKNNRNIDEFYEYINNLRKNDFSPIDIPKIDLPDNKPLQNSIKHIFRDYNDSDLTINEYYTLSQMNCFYCELSPKNNFNIARCEKNPSIKKLTEGNYIYNGIDRIDSALSHSKNNVVSCCKYCNFAKNKLSLNEFNNWIERIKNYDRK